MKSSRVRRFSITMNSLFVACLAFAAHGAANVFDDAVFWFRGGKDCVTADGNMQQGEFFDDLHADNDAHANHQMSMVNYSINAFKANAAFVSEQVIFPALGKSEAKDMQVLRLSNKAVKNGNAYYFWPETVNPRSVFANNYVTNEFTIISRMRLDDDGQARAQCVFKIGYKATEKRGMYLAFSELQDSTGTKYILGRRTPAETGDDASFSFTDLQIPTNTWFDLAVAVGNGKLRVGIALPETSGGNSTIVFAETPMWTGNLLSTGDDYRLFAYTGQSSYLAGNASGLDKTCFLGSVQQMAIWGRALGDEEVMAAFGMPRPALFRTGFDNGNSNEFGGSRSGVMQEIDGLGSWQSIVNTMAAGDTWMVNFTALRDEAGLPQIFSIKSLLDSAVAYIEPTLSNASHNVSLGSRRVAANGRTFWPVPSDLIAEGANTLIIKRKSGEAGTFKMDAMELGGSLGVGNVTQSSTDDERIDPECIATGVPSAADPNPQHWPTNLVPSTGIKDLHFRVWIDPDVVDKASFTLKTAVRCDITSSESFSVYTNKAYATRVYANADWKSYSLPFQPGDLHGGWNDLDFYSTDSRCWEFDYYRFETVLPKGFSIPPPGMTISIR